MALVLVSYSICVLLLLQVHRPITANLAKVECRGGSRGAIGAIAPLKPTKVTFFTMILYNSERHFTAN